VRRQLLTDTRLLGAFGAASIALATTACGDAHDLESRGALSHQIVNGEESDERDQSVLFLAAKPPNSTGFSCTATLVAPNLVFTALHCLAYYSGGSFYCKPDGSLVAMRPGDGSLGAVAAPDQVQVYSGVNHGTEPDAIGIQVFGTGSTEICRNDFAAVLLDRDLPFPVASLRMARPMKRGELMTVVGYGWTENEIGEGRRRRQGVEVIDVGPEAVGQAGSNTAAPRTFVLSEGACLGDSGGPAFSGETGALAGVYSLASGANCTTTSVRNIYTRLSPFNPLVQQAFAASGYEPVLEPYEAPTEPEPEPEPEDELGGSGSRSDGCTLGAPRSASGGAWASALMLALAYGVRRVRVS
jgi:hypothetical protein